MDAMMPRSMKPIVDAIGISASLLLVQALGGKTLYVPSLPRLAAGHPLVMIVGADAASRLSLAMSGCSLELPLCSRYLEARRDAEIAIRFKAGESDGALAREYRLHVRTVRRIAKRTETVAA